MNYNMNYADSRQGCDCQCRAAQRQTAADPPEFGMPLAMAYVPWQQWEEPYPCDMALLKGTIFPSLYLPFKGSKRRQCRG